MYAPYSPSSKFQGGISKQIADFNAHSIRGFFSEKKCLLRFHADVVDKRFVVSDGTSMLLYEEVETNEKKRRHVITKAFRNTVWKGFCPLSRDLFLVLDDDGLG
jgi:hypothetical protein